MNQVISNSKIKLNLFFSDFFFFSTMIQNFLCGTDLILTASKKTARRWRWNNLLTTSRRNRNLRSPCYLRVCACSTRSLCLRLSSRNAWEWSKLDLPLLIFIHQLNLSHFENGCDVLVYVMLGRVEMPTQFSSHWRILAFCNTESRQWLPCRCNIFLMYHGKMAISKTHEYYIATHRETQSLLNLSM